MSEQNKALVRRLLEDDISKGDRAVAEAIIAPDFFDHTNPPGMQRGLEGHNAIVALFRAAFPDQWWQIEDLIAEGDRVVARTDRPVAGMPKKSPRCVPVIVVRVGGMHILRIAAGKIAEHWGNNDDLGLLRQLGAIPEPSAAR